MKKYVFLAVVITIVLTIGGCTNAKTHNKTNAETTNSKAEAPSKVALASDSDIKIINSNVKKINIEDARNFEVSLNNGSVISVTRDSSKELEIYNIASLDKFMEDFNNHKVGYVRIIKGTLIDGKIKVNKLAELQSGGKSIKVTEYDCYANKDSFTPGEPIYVSKIGKINTESGLRYTLCPTNDTDDDSGATLISFEKKSIKK